MNVGDYIKFTRIVRPAVKQKIRDGFKGNHDAVIEAEQIIECRGSGIIDSISAHGKRLDGRVYRTARVDAGAILGQVTAILDDAILIGVQQQMGIALEDAPFRNMYDTTGDVA